MSSFVKAHEDQFDPALNQAALSACLILFAFFALIVAGDTFKAPVWFDRPHRFVHIGYYVGSPLESLSMIGLFAVPLAIWHASDLFSKRDDEHKAKLWVSYSPVLICLMLGLLGTLVLATGFTEWLSCYRPEPIKVTESGFEAAFLCTPRIGFLGEFIVLPFLLSLVIFAIVKLLSVVREKFS